MQQLLQIEFLFLKSGCSAMENCGLAIRSQMSGASSGRDDLDDGDSAARIEHVSARPRDLSQHVNDACPGYNDRVTRSEFDIVGRHFGGIFGDRQGV